MQWFEGGGGRAVHGLHPGLETAVGGFLRCGRRPGGQQGAGERGHAEGVLRLSVGAAGVLSGAGIWAAETGGGGGTAGGAVREWPVVQVPSCGGGTAGGHLGRAVLLRGVWGQRLHAACRRAARAAAEGVAYAGASIEDTKPSLKPVRWQSASKERKVESDETFWRNYFSRCSSCE